MNKVTEATEILASLGLPKAQQNDRSALTLLALAGIEPRSSWWEATANLLRTVDIMAFIREKHGKDYAPNSRETFRRQTLHQFEQARLVDRNPDDPTRPTNSGKNAYALTSQALAILRTYRSPQFNARAAGFIRDHGSLAKKYAGVREGNLMPLQLPDGSTVLLSPGKHNELQVAVINQLGPRFAAGAEVLYIGDTAKKHVVFEANKLKALRVPITEHDKLPDVILYSRERNWLFLIEAVTSHGPVSPKRHHELEEVLSRCTAERVYVTAFLDMAGFRKYAGDIAWETEVWVAETPDHMIHFNGPKFLGPYKAEEG